MKNFRKNPNLRFKLNICQTNTSKGIIDIFAVFISSIDKKEYLISPNYLNNLMEVNAGLLYRF